LRVKILLIVQREKLKRLVLNYTNERFSLSVLIIEDWVIGRISYNLLKTVGRIS